MKLLHFLLFCGIISCIVIRRKECAGRMANHRKAYLEITNVCNLRCAFCPGTKRTPRSLNEDEFSRLAGRLTPWAEYLYYHLMGEPTAHPLLPQFIEIARSLGLKSIITTNGTLLSSRGRSIIEARPHKVCISLHSFEANENGRPFEEYIDDCVGFARDGAADGIIVVLRLWNLDGRAEGAQNKKNAAILERLHEAFPGEWKSVRSGEKIGERVYLEWGEKFDWPTAAEGDAREGFCYALRDQIGVLCDGSVVPCCLDRDGEMVLGNLFDDSLEDILSRPRARAIYDGFSRHECVEPLCKGCMRSGYYR